MAPDIEHIKKRYLPTAEFTRRIEELIEKENPDRVVAWLDKPPPDWAKNFNPKIFLDLGCGLGGQTCATLTRLAQWGCLGQLERIVVIDHDVDLHPGGAHGLKTHLEKRIGETINSLGIKEIKVDAYVDDFIISRDDSGKLQADLLNIICPKADIILASHVTYFFGNGSGQLLLEALWPHLSITGKVWVNIRDRNCSAYSKRIEILEYLNIQEEQPYDYSEYFASSVIPVFKNLTLLEKKSIDVDVRAGVDRFLAAKLIMWRMDINSDDEQMVPLLQASFEVSSRTTSLYSETQFILTLTD